MKLKNLVSIIMTCHNGQRFLNEAVDSLIKQTHENWELIFYNNYSSDRSKNIILKYNDKRIRYFETDKILSLGDIRNRSILKVKGDYICFLDVDDLWENNKIEKQLSLFQSLKNLDVVSSNYRILSGKKFVDNKFKVEKKYSQKEIIVSYINGSPITSWLTLMIKKNSIKKLPYSFDKKLHISSDFDLIIRLSNFANFYFINSYLCTYRLHNKNESKNKKRELSELMYIFGKFKNNRNILRHFNHKLFLIKVKIKYYLFKFLI